MKAVVHDRYGPPDVLRLEEVEPPVPRADEVLVLIRATTVNRTDCHRRAADPFMWRLFAGLGRPRRRILGSELAGEVAAAGQAVTEFPPGDQVLGLSPWQLGAHAEFVCLPAGGLLARKPDGVGFEQAAAVCDGGLNALASLRRADVGQGKRILVYGASGSIGTAAVQLARYLGADVTAVCNTKNVETVRSLGAGRVIDYTREDFTANGQAYDVIYDAVGTHSFRRCAPSLKPGGKCLATDGLQNVVLAAGTARLAGKKVVFPVPPRYAKQDVLFLGGLIEAGEYRPVIDRCCPLEQVVQATRYVETQQKTETSPSRSAATAADRRARRAPALGRAVAALEARLAAHLRDQHHQGGHAEHDPVRNGYPLQPHPVAGLVLTEPEQQRPARRGKADRQGQGQPPRAQARRERGAEERPDLQAGPDRAG
jgi:NADPH:quinone reductase-like Zn-dependent oxidoreductase